jgi:hypothetical protein
MDPEIMKEVNEKVFAIMNNLHCTEKEALQLLKLQNEAKMFELDLKIKYKILI